MKTKVLIIWAVTAQLICTFVFAYTNSWFSHDTAQMHVLFSFIGASMDGVFILVHEASGLQVRAYLFFTMGQPCLC